MKLISLLVVMSAVIGWFSLPLLFALVGIALFVAMAGEVMSVDA